MLGARLFVPDDRYDRDHASDLSSRYGAYLRRNLARFLDAEDLPTRDPLEFAAAAWQIAQAPVMSPPYVLAHRRVLGTVPLFDDAGRLAISVEVAADVPAELVGGLRGRWVGWDRRQRWSAPVTNDHPVATAVLHFRVPMSAEGLPRPSYSALAEPDVATAKDAISIVCGRLDAALSGAFAQFDRKEVA